MSSDKQKSKQIEKELEGFEKKEEELLDHIYREAHENRDIHGKINSTVDGQGKIIAALDKRTDQNIHAMQLTGTRLDDIVAKQSYGCLYITIVVEFLLLIFMLAFV